MEHLRLLQERAGLLAALQTHRPAAAQQKIQPGARLRRLAPEQTGKDEIPLSDQRFMIKPHVIKQERRVTHSV